MSVSAYLDQTDRDTLQKDITDGKFPGVRDLVGPPAVAAVADATGMTFLDATACGPLTDVALSGAHGMALVERGLDVPTLYVAGAAAKVGTRADPDDRAGSRPVAAHAGKRPRRRLERAGQPGLLRRSVTHRPADRRSTRVVEPHANPGRLRRRPAALRAGAPADGHTRPQVDRMQLLALAPDGQLATVDVGHNAFAWRLPGVAMGTLTAVCVYLLARLLFRRRSVGLIAAVLVASGHVRHANARIAMNDTYVTGFMIAAVTLFTPLYLGIWRRKWQIAAGLIGVGLLLGLALASKWVALYAMGGFLLVLLRSALGRIIALAAMIAMTRGTPRRARSQSAPLTSRIRTSTCSSCG